MNILIGISAGISAYKIPELVRLFVKDNHNVKTILTKDAEYFLTKTTLETLSKNKVYTDAFDLTEGVAHIELAKWADLFIVAPATADFMAKLACGLGSHILYSTLLAYKKKCLIFPSMNADMFENSIVQENIQKLKNRGFLIYEPEAGDLACGVKGSGRLPEIETIFEISKLEIFKQKKDFKNKKVLITAGSTRANIDEVRFITNGSSGKMGFSLIKEAFIRGAELTLACNKEFLEKFKVNYYVKKVILLETSDDAYDRLKDSFIDSDIYISACAFCDYKSINYEKKLNRSDLTLELKGSDDVFKSLTKIKDKQIMVGFALESDNIETKAINKLKNKAMDLVVANDLTSIGSDENDFIIIDKKLKKTFLKNVNKQVLAEKIFDKIIEIK